MGPILEIHKFWAKHFKWASGKPTGVKTCQPWSLFLINTPNYADMMYWGPHCRDDSEVWWTQKLVLGPQWKRKCFKGNFHYVSKHQQLLGPRSIAGTAAVGSSCRYSAKLASVGYTIGGWWLTQQFVVCYNQPAPPNPFLSLSRQTIYLSKNIFYGQHYVKNNILCKRKYLW